MGDYGEALPATSKQRVVGSNPTWDTRQAAFSYHRLAFLYTLIIYITKEFLLLFLRAFHRGLWKLDTDFRR